ncbi:MAG: hypothetical protein A2806_01250 [Candidatus Terrybacteria bacterium RIFCSPHIGHO2_01_FULL_48_17]|uniref:Cytochrome c domain-containing protein n=1 Tax=Candidatus Terrybacteria bacterium RIFCSPHIGHO2_01_FULL_48_17 TaxID=1802362 RepID=A0A1G2PK91_9BACT|nr:MAG: hypothetical protein A2806_01250 [Candidatus Terrybacteria bacterium RIFCSPHIGHO2_01_FULL_48_17]OHA53438.1 MAG: hypothetical protein A3A30_02700 [Candidatus Terrybacteria bacterium RIFCSPLOWO2_01_FULL_48_14]
MELLSEYEKYARGGQRISGEVSISSADIAAFKKQLNALDELRKLLQQIEPRDFGVAVNLVLAGGLFADASDIHIEPQEKKSLVRLRIDGILQDIAELEQEMYNLVLERLKLLAGLKLNVRDRAQDGRFTIHVEQQDIEIRASSLPGKYGEFVTLRILNPRNLLSLEELGLRQDLLEKIREGLKQPNGMILTTGPTGSGKTTLLYALVRHVTTPKVKIITIEDPIEYRIRGIEQTQVDTEAKYTFAVGLRSIVRQDPDYVLVGEVRDIETANIALQAALTGHLVFSTLHTNDAPGAIPRLIELGAKPETIAPALSLIIGQRLLRRLCKECATSATLNEEMTSRIKKALAGLPAPLMPTFSKGLELFYAKGCAACHNTGYRGRVGIFELFPMDSAMESLTLKKPSTFEVRKTAAERGMVTMQQDGLLRVLDGTTDTAELERVTGPLEDMEELFKIK